MTKITTATRLPLFVNLETAWQDVESYERSCLTAGIGAIEKMLHEDAARLAGGRHVLRS